MESSSANSDAYRTVSSSSISANSSGHHSRRHQGIHMSAANILRSPVSTLLEYTGILRTRTTANTSTIRRSESADNVLLNGSRRVSDLVHNRDNHGADHSTGEVSIRIISGGGTTEHEHSVTNDVIRPQSQSISRSRSGSASLLSSLESQVDLRTNDPQSMTSDAEGGGSGNNNTGNTGNRDSSTSYQRYDIQQAARWIEQVLPFSLLLLVVFIRQHLQGFCSTIWVAAVMFKSNDILRKQTALKDERRLFVLIGMAVLFTLHTVGIYWWYWNDDLIHPFIMLPPKAIPPFWHAIFIIMVNDTLVRQGAMVLKLVLLMYYKNSRGRNYRRQGQMLTLVEYVLLFYRALLPAPVWYRFFLNKEYGSLFSSLITGLYLTFKLTSIVEKVQSCITALKALSRKDINYGAYATSEQVIAAGDLCAICQEKMHAPVLLRCKHIFCEDCVSEWFERERTCPLCRALVKPAELRSFGDGSTSLFFQLF